MDTTSPSAEQPEAPAVDSSKAEAQSYLESLINKTLRVYTTDSRLQPSQQKLLEAAASLESDTLRAEMTSRYLGLVVVPGEHIVKIEVEEFVSQMKNRSILGRPDIYASA
ncbi:hypothetical protein KJ359_012718 [Pestalotiopsis sp. 9143b]|nr:hypothetical protein KJ359_012718 [Pestalotiopsis sp. 9143b]